MGSQKVNGVVSDPDDEQPSKTGPYISQGLERSQLRSEAVSQAMSRVPRHRFVPEDVEEFAYEDRALPIGAKQTISQPFIVAYMTQAAEVGKGARVLEVGTGSGFQAAVLAELGAKVYSVEIVPELAERAAKTLQELGYDSVSVRKGDGWEGWEEEAPFDAIIVTAAAPRPPETLLRQLANRGKMVIPIEERGADGELLMVIERKDQDFITKNLGAVRFVPMTGEARK